VRRRPAAGDTLAQRLPAQGPAPPPPLAPTPDPKPPGKRPPPPAPRPAAFTRWVLQPRRVEALVGVKVAAIAAGAFYSGAIDADGNVFMWGRGDGWQLGTGLNTHECLPQQVGGGAAWGGGGAGRCCSGRGRAPERARVPEPTRRRPRAPLPPQLRTVRHAARLALGWTQSVAISSHGATATWGTDDSGSLGQGFKWPRPACPTPQVRARGAAGPGAGGAPGLVGPTAAALQATAPARTRHSPCCRPRPPLALQGIGLRLAAAASGWRHCAGCDDDGRLFTWGWGGAPGGGGLLSPNEDLGGGQLGLGDDRDAHEPAQVLRLLLGGGAFRDLRQSAGPGGGLWRAAGVACGRNHTAAVVEVEAAAGEVT
jgi:alpha-tubulin suppressor-like RCC1 family protein